MIEFIEQGPGYDLILWLQSWRTETIVNLLLPFNYIGTQTFFMIALPVVYWAVNKRLGRELALFFMINSWLNTVCKAWWKRPRPCNVTVPGKEQVVPAVFPPKSYGIPSGHTMAGVGFFGFLAAEIRSRPWRVALILCVVLLPLSRMVHGVHYPQDIVAGFLLSGGLLLAWILLRERLRHFAANCSLTCIVLLALAFCLASALIAFVTSAEPQAIEMYVSMTASVAAGMIGLKIEHGYIRFMAESGSIARRILRVACGLALMVALYAGLTFLFEAGEFSRTITLLLRFIRYSVLALWITAGAPWLFVKTGLAEQK